MYKTLLKEDYKKQLDNVGEANQVKVTKNTYNSTKVG